MDNTTPDHAAPFRVGLLGASLDTGNQGVSALAASLVKIIRACKPTAEITLFVGNRSAAPQKVRGTNETVYVAVQNFRLSPKASWERHVLVIFCKALLCACMPVRTLRDKIIASNDYLQALVHCDFIGDIRGGDSFSDIYGVQRFIIGSMPACIALLLGKKLVLLPQTYGPYTAAGVKIAARQIIKRAAIVLTRDPEGEETIQNLFMGTRHNIRVQFCPDVAFVLDAVPPETVEIVPALPAEKKRTIIGINVNGLMYHGGYTRDNMFDLSLDYKKFLHALVAALLDTPDSHVLLIPHTYMPAGDVNSDTHASRELLHAFSRSPHCDRLHVVEKEYDQSAIKAIIGRCDFFVGSRMHSCIAALSQGIPTVGVAYSKKFMGVFDSIHAGHDVIDARTVATQVAVQRTLRHITQRNALHAQRLHHVAAVKKHIMEIFNHIFNASCP